MQLRSSRDPLVLVETGDGHRGNTHPPTRHCVPAVTAPEWAPVGYRLVHARPPNRRSLRVVSATLCRWPWRLTLTSPIELVRSDAMLE
jgi:hypothetical protein